MKNNLYNSEQYANYLLGNNTNIRQTAKHFNISKSTIHYQLNKKLKYENYHLYLQTKKYLKYNFDTKHIRGGMATKKKYEELKNIKTKINIDTSNNF